MEYEQTSLLFNPKIGENVIFSFVTVADSVKIPLKTNNSVNTTFTAKPFYQESILAERKGLMQKNSNKKILCHSLFKFSENAKMKAKISALS